MSRKFQKFQILLALIFTTKDFVYCFFIRLRISYKLRSSLVWSVNAHYIIKISTILKCLKYSVNFTTSIIYNFTELKGQHNYVLLQLGYNLSYHNSSLFCFAFTQFLYKFRILATNIFRPQHIFFRFMCTVKWQ